MIVKKNKNNKLKKKLKRKIIHQLRVKVRGNSDSRNKKQTN